jgi:hypothetical protein
VIGLREAEAEPGQPREVKIDVDERHYAEERAPLATDRQLHDLEALGDVRRQALLRHRVVDEREMVQLGDDVDEAERPRLEPPRQRRARRFPVHSHDDNASLAPGVVRVASAA